MNICKKCGFKLKSHCCPDRYKKLKANVSKGEKIRFLERYRRLADKVFSRYYEDCVKYDKAKNPMEQESHRSRMWDLKYWETKDSIKLITLIRARFNYSIGTSDMSMYIAFRGAYLALKEK